jgi:transposase
MRIPADHEDNGPAAPYNRAQGATRLIESQPGRRALNVPTPLIAHLNDQHGELAIALDLAPDFAAIVRERQPDRFDSWLARATVSAVAPLRRLAPGLRAVSEAVNAGLRRPCSHGPVAGQITRLKMLQRSMFGRAKIALLSRRFLLAACAKANGRRAVSGSRSRA